LEKTHIKPNFSGTPAQSNSLLKKIYFPKKTVLSKHKLEKYTD